MFRAYGQSIYVCVCVFMCVCVCCVRVCDVYVCHAFGVQATLTSKDKDKSAATTGRAKPAAAGGQNSEGLFSMFG